MEETVLRQMLTIYLDSYDAQSDAPAAPAKQVLIDCTGAQTTIRIDDQSTRRSLHRRLDLGLADASVRERLLALTIAELLNVLRIEVPAIESEPSATR